MSRDEPMQPDKDSRWLQILAGWMLICILFNWRSPFEQAIALMIVLVLAFLLWLGKGRDNGT